MQPLETYDLVLNALVLVMMPLIMWANLKSYGLQSPLNQYLWREHPAMMRVAILVLGILVVNSALQLLRYFGLVSPPVAETLAILVGVPFLVAAVAMIWLSIRALLKVLRERGTRSKA